MSKNNTTGNSQSPIRMCVICRQRFVVAELSRHVLDQDGIFCLDAKKKRPGRGWYCCQSAQCVARFASYRPKGRRETKNTQAGTGR